MDEKLSTILGLEIVTSYAIPKGKLFVHPETYGGPTPEPPKVLAVENQWRCTKCGGLQDESNDGRCYLHHSPGNGWTICDPVTVTVTERKEK